MTDRMDEDVFQAVKPHVSDYRATFPEEGAVTFTLFLVDGRLVQAAEAGPLEQVHLTHARAQKAAWRSAYDLLVGEGAIEEGEG